MRERVINIVDIDQAMIKTGDILIGRRFTGSSAEWMLLSGGHADHAAMVIEARNETGGKYVIDCPADLGYYAGRGSSRITELSEWLGQHLA